MLSIQEGLILACAREGGLEMKMCISPPQMRASILYCCFNPALGPPQRTEGDVPQSAQSVLKAGHQMPEALPCTNAAVLLQMHPPPAKFGDLHVRDYCRNTLSCASLEDADEHILWFPV